MKIAFYILLLLVLVACGDKSQLIGESALEFPVENNVADFTDSRIEFKNNVIQIDQVEEDVLIQEIEQQREDVLFRVKRMDTKHYLMRKGLKNEELEKALIELEDEQLFYVEFEESQKRDLMKKYFEQHMDESVSYLSFKIDQDFSLVQSDTIDAASLVYERNYHVAPFERILISFKGIDKDEEMEIIYRDKLFQKGEMKFHFPSKKYITKKTETAL